MHSHSINSTLSHINQISPKTISHTVCVLSEQLIGIQENVEVLPKETVIEVTESTETVIAKEQKVETEIQETTELRTTPG